MSALRIAELPRRGVVAVAGADATRFLNDLLTTDVPNTPSVASYGGLLMPQGKILFDFIAFRDRERYLFDLPRTLAADFVKRLGFYRLRAQVAVADLSSDHVAVAAWGGAAAPILDGPSAPDPRLASLGYRGIVPAGADMAPDYNEATEADYDARRIALGVPEGGIDFAFGEAFPHDAVMDQLAGVDFKKGCFIGQEVVSRMEHRGTARRRFVGVIGAAALPPAGTSIIAAGKEVGTIGSSMEEQGVALVRLDRARDANAAGTPITAGGVTVTLTLPAWATFGWPKEAAGG